MDSEKVILIFAKIFLTLESLDQYSLLIAVGLTQI